MAVYYDGYDWDTDGFPGDYVYGNDEYVDDYHMDERWKPIYDVPGYWISTKARVWSSLSNSFIEGTQLRSGHIDISLRQNGRRVHKFLHRLVAEAFIPNPYGYPEVRHLNDDPTDNDLDNLAWGTQYDNIQDCIRNGHFRYFTSEDVERANEIRRIPVVAVRLRDGWSISFNSQQDASRSLGIRQSSISDVLRGRSRSAGGYFFVLEKDYDPSNDYTNHVYQRRGVCVKATNRDTGITRIYRRPRHAAYDLGISEASVSNVLRDKVQSARGWIFEEISSEEVGDGHIY